MKIFKDKELTQEIDNSNLIDFGILEAGNSKKITVWILNDSEAELRRLSFSVAHSEIVVVSYPDRLESNKVEPLVMKWTASISVKQGLRAKLLVTGAELWS